MFLAHIAYSLELISLAVGTLLVFIAHRHCHHVMNTTQSSYPSQLPKNKEGKGFVRGFMAFIGYLIIILSIVGYICTSISYFRGRPEIDYKNLPTNEMNIPQNNNLENTPPISPSTPNP